MLRLWVSRILYYTGLLNLLRLFNNIAGQRLTIVMLHRVTPADYKKGTSLASICLSRQNFERAIDYIARHYRVISFSEYSVLLKESKPIPVNSMIITFDDGYRDVYSEALPVLKKRDLPSTLFVVSATLVGDKLDLWWDRLTFYCHLLGAERAKSILRAEIHQHTTGEVSNAFDYTALDPDAIAIAAADVLSGTIEESRNMVLEQLRKSCPEEAVEFNCNTVSPDEIREMMQNGVEIGCHTKNHCFLDVVSDDEAHEEIADSRAIIKGKLSAEVDTFAYPGGRLTPKIREMVISAGYEFAVSIETGLNNRSRDPYLLKRINLCDDWVEDSAGQFQPSLLATRLVLTEIIQQLKGLKEALLSWRNAPKHSGTIPVSVARDHMENVA